MSDWVWPASQITNVVDGDTFDAMLSRDLGFGGRAVFPVRLRLNRVNAPPLHTAAGAASRQALVALLGTVVDLTTLHPYKYGGPADQAGEWMAEVITPDGRNVSNAMVEGGFAVTWDGKGARPGG